MQITLASIDSLTNFKAIQRSLMDLDDLKFNGGINLLTIGDYSLRFEFFDSNFNFEDLQNLANELKQFYTLIRINNNEVIFYCESLKKEFESQ